MLTYLYFVILCGLGAVSMACFLVISGLYSALSGQLRFHARPALLVSLVCWALVAASAPNLFAN
ncbi:hypothetical protein ACYPKM_02045 [Pseudomonas aeruginosa]